MIRRYAVEIDIAKSSVKHERIAFNEEDRNSAFLSFTVLNNSTSVDLTNMLITAVFVKPDKTVVTQDLDNGITITSPTEGMFEIGLNTEALALFGIVKLEVTITDAGTVIASRLMKFKVNRSLRSDAETVSKNDLSFLATLEDLILRAKGIDFQSISLLDAEKLKQVTDTTTLTQLLALRVAAVNEILDSPNLQGLLGLNTVAVEGVVNHPKINDLLAIDMIRLSEMLANGGLSDLDAAAVNELMQNPNLSKVLALNTTAINALVNNTGLANLNTTAINSLLANPNLNNVLGLNTTEINALLNSTTLDSLLLVNTTKLNQLLAQDVNNLINRNMFVPSDVAPSTTDVVWVDTTEWVMKAYDDISQSWVILAPTVDNTGGGGAVPTLVEINETIAVPAKTSVAVSFDTGYDKYDIRVVDAQSVTNQVIAVSIYEDAAHTKLVYRSLESATIYDILNLPCIDKDASLRIHMMIENISSTAASVKLIVKVTNLN